MDDIRLGIVESHFADIVWEHAPLRTAELVSLCEEALEWKRTTTYTVLKRLCDRGIFKMENSVVHILIPKTTFYAMMSERFVDETYHGSLPAFIAAFTSRKTLSAEELKQIRLLLDTFEEE